LSSPSHIKGARLICQWCSCVFQCHICSAANRSNISSLESGVGICKQIAVSFARV